MFFLPSFFYGYAIYSILYKRMLPSGRNNPERRRNLDDDVIRNCQRRNAVAKASKNRTHQVLADMLNRDDFADLVQASQSSTGFWNNDTDDEVWNHV